MIPVKDRIPTKPYRRKITHEESALPQYTIDEYGHLIITIPDVEYAMIERADEPTEDGTPINKLLFDSIDTDVRARLLISDKATQAEAEAGTNENHYTTPKTVQQKLDVLVKTDSGTASTSGSVLVNLNWTVYENKIVTVRGYGDCASGVGFKLTLSGTEILSTGQGQGKHPFEITFDLTTKTYFGIFYENSTNGYKTIGGTADSFTSLKLVKTGSGSGNVPWAISIRRSN